MGPDMFRASNSLAALAYHNELSGHKMFRCSTIQREGWCLGAECDLFQSTIDGTLKLPAIRGGLGAKPPIAGSAEPAPLPTSTIQTTIPDMSGVDWSSLMKVKPIEREL
jgi:hypothetical protein